MGQFEVGLILAGFVTLLGVLIVARRVGSKRVLRTFCLACEQPFEASAKMDALGFRHMTCPSCEITAAYPMSNWLVATYAFVFTVACAAVICRLVADPSWLPDGRAVWVFVVVPAIALVRNRNRSRLLAFVAADKQHRITPMERVDSPRR